MFLKAVQLLLSNIKVGANCLNSVFVTMAAFSLNSEMQHLHISFTVTVGALAIHTYFCSSGLLLVNVAQYISPVMRSPSSQTFHLNHLKPQPGNLYAAPPPKWRHTISSRKTAWCSSEGHGKSPFMHAYFRCRWQDFVGTKRQEHCIHWSNIKSRHGGV